MKSWGKIDGTTCPTTTQCIDPCVVEADLDIVGIGIRIGAYVQTISNILSVGFALEDGQSKVAYGTLILTSLITVMTMSISLLRGTLSLSYSEAASTLLSITIFPMQILESQRIRSPGLFVAQQGQLWVQRITYLWINIHMPCLGIDHECNLCTRSSFLGHSGHTISPFRRSFRLAILISFSFRTLRSYLWLYGPLHTLQSVPVMFSQAQRKKWISYIDQTHESLTHSRLQRLRQQKASAKAKNPNARLWSIIYIRLWVNDQTTIQSTAKQLADRKPPCDFGNRNWLSRVWAGTKIAVRVPRCQKAFLILIYTAFSIWDMENTTTLNFTVSRNDWGYGQTFALIATIPSVTAIITILLRMGRKPDESRKLASTRLEVERAFTL